MRRSGSERSDALSFLKMGCSFSSYRLQPVFVFDHQPPDKLPHHFTDCRPDLVVVFARLWGLFGKVWWWG
jgi:hypothetical protein